MVFFKINYFNLKNADSTLIKDYNRYKVIFLNSFGIIFFK